MKKIISPFSFLLFAICTTAFAQDFSKEEISQWQKQAKRITIIRDNWDVPHIYGKTDADCVFGLMYAQCEDNYRDIEENNIESLGRAAELYGEASLEDDANVARFECVKKGKDLYANAGLFLKSICNAAAAGINYYLYTHPGVERRLLHRYEPWFFLVTDTYSPAGHGITRAERIKAYTISIKSQPEGSDKLIYKNESGSNAMALAPAKTKSGHSMLLINPHVNLSDRYEAHLISEQGLNVSGFAFFGSIYIWSGFNENAGWAHTNTASDYEDVYLEHFNHPSDSTLYKYGDGYRKAVFWNDTLLYKSGDSLKQKVFLFRKTHRGPVTAKRDAWWVTVQNANSNPAQYLLQVWAMSKAKNLKEFTAVMGNVQLSTNTMYADRFGNIAYWHGNAIPRRNINFDWRSPVDGSNPETEWKGVHPLNEIVHIINPLSGWLQNCNTPPFEAAGKSSPKKENYPVYMSYETASFRSEEAIRLLSATGQVSFTDFEHMVMSNHLPMMANWLPQIIAAYNKEIINQPELQTKLKYVVDTLQKWNYRYSTTSQATTLGVFWCIAYRQWLIKQGPAFINTTSTNFWGQKQLPVPDSIAVSLLSMAADTLKRRYGTAFIQWGEINRLQRINRKENFDDNKFSLPVAAVPGWMGSLFAFYPRTASDGSLDQGERQKKLYGMMGNSYVAIIEFGPRVKAKSIHCFGHSYDPGSLHYYDQSHLYVQGKFKEAYFYKEDVLKHAERKYHPGE
ncbi:MAG: penicillin acylase family protein [Chitinophagaceae bacterium]